MPTRKMAVAASDIVLKGRTSFSVDPKTLSAEAKKDFVTRNLQVRGLQLSVETKLHLPFNDYSSSRLSANPTPLV